MENDESSPPAVGDETTPELMETIVVPEDQAGQEVVPGTLLEACPACGTLMDVTDQTPFAQIFCPSCGQSLRARKQFNNFKLIKLLGEGGMGAVFEALDCNLHRRVALKILKKECSANAEERAKLEQEARLTASINHPHVVKVFSFGEDHGQFYLAMELVEKGSLDQLMGLQKRVAEAQILDVGIQIAGGLNAALESGLIHRDIKPGNILFADAHTAKLVDFGLAIVMDEAAQARGEIWGTPYYIAPEKLDNQVEDFRSDIYSLGGTLFHAVAGRPPYEAETASMVALKQLKSQPISLQAFAPSVSSETAYVINRMMAKNPDDRYQSYSELIEHLSYAKHKLEERSARPPAPKARVVLETQQTKNATALISLGLLLTVVLLGVVLYLYRGTLFPGLAASPPAPSAAYSKTEAEDLLRQAVALAAARNYEDARTEFNRLASSPGLDQPLKNWALMNEALSELLAGGKEKAASLFEAVMAGGVYSTDPEQSARANFFVEAAKMLVDPDKVIPPSITRLFSNKNFEAFGLLCFGLHDWEAGAILEAGPILNAFLQAEVPGPESWIEDYKPLAGVYLADYNRLKAIEDALPGVADAAAAAVLLEKVRQAREAGQTGSRLTDRLDAIEQELAAKGAVL